MNATSSQVMSGTPRMSSMYTVDMMRKMGIEEARPRARSTHST